MFLALYRYLNRGEKWFIADGYNFLEQDDTPFFFPQRLGKKTQASLHPAATAPLAINQLIN
jgi:hypothetical protein